MAKIGQNNYEIEQQLAEGPDQVANALIKWRMATLDREKAEALLYARLKGEDDNRTATEIKELIRADNGRYEMVVSEIKAEAEYNRYYEKLMSAKKISALRTAF